VQNGTLKLTNRALGWLDRAWFPEVAPWRLAVVRILTGSYILYYLSTRFTMLMRSASADASFFEPVGWARILSAPLPPPVYEIVLWLTLFVNLAFVLGFGYRLTGPLFSLLLLFVMSYKNSWSTIHHSHNLLVMHVFVLGFVRAADSLSVDRTVEWLAAKFEMICETAVHEVHSRYGWPIQLLCGVTVATYFLAGVAKVLGPLGWGWACGEAVRSQLAIDGLRKELLGDGASPLFVGLYQHLWFFGAMGVGTLILEFGAPFALLFRSTRWIWTFSMFAVHWCIFYLMEIKFRYQLAGIAFVPLLICYLPPWLTIPGLRRTFLRT